MLLYPHVFTGLLASCALCKVGRSHSEVDSDKKTCHAHSLIYLGTCLNLCNVGLFRASKQRVTVAFDWLND